MGVQDSHRVEGVTSCLSFCNFLFLWAGSGSPGLPLRILRMLLHVSVFSVIFLWAGNGSPGLPLCTGTSILLSVPFPLLRQWHPVHPPTVPILLHILNGAMTAADLLPNGTISYTLPKNKVVDITFNTDTAAGGPVSPFSKHHALID
jgi:hypothetical protein